MKYTIANIAGGNEREFAWNSNGISLRALRHAASVGFGGPEFGGEAGSLAFREYQQIEESWRSGECTEEVREIFEA